MRQQQKIFLALAFPVAFLLAGCSRGVARGESGSESRSPGDPVARVNGQVITYGELTAEAKLALDAVDAKYAEEIHGAKLRALDGLIQKKVLEAAAKKQGISVDALFEREVASKIPLAPETYLQAVYDQTKANGRVVPPFAQAKAEIAAFVRNQEVQKGRLLYGTTIGLRVLVPAK